MHVRRQQKGSFPRQPHSADAQQRPARAQTPQIEVIAPEPQDAGDPAEQPSAFPQGIDEDQTADLAEDIDLEQELEGALEVVPACHSAHAAVLCAFRTPSLLACASVSTCK